MEIKTLEEMEVLLTSDTLEKLKRLGNEFNAKIMKVLEIKYLFQLLIYWTRLYPTKYEGQCL